jgi:hypothetical protein
MAVPVLAEYVRHMERVNVENSFYARRDYLVDLETARGRVAAALGVEVDEIAGPRKRCSVSSAVTTASNPGIR